MWRRSFASQRRLQQKVSGLALRKTDCYCYVLYKVGCYLLILWGHVFYLFLDSLTKPRMNGGTEPTLRRLLENMTWFSWTTASMTRQGVMTPGVAQSLCHNRPILSPFMSSLQHSFIYQSSFLLPLFHFIIDRFFHSFFYLTIHHSFFFLYPYSSRKRLSSSPKLRPRRRPLSWT